MTLGTSGASKTPPALSMIKFLFKIQWTLIMFIINYSRVNTPCLSLLFMLYLFSPFLLSPFLILLSLWTYFLWRLDTQRVFLKCMHVCMVFIYTYAQIIVVDLCIPYLLIMRPVVIYEYNILDFKMKCNIFILQGIDIVYLLI